jgi:hypothetical protein
MAPYLDSVTVRLSFSSHGAYSFFSVLSIPSVLRRCPHYRRRRRHPRLLEGFRGPRWHFWCVSLLHMSASESNRRPRDLLGSTAFGVVQTDMRGNIAVRAGP